MFLMIFIVFLNLIILFRFWVLFNMLILLLSSLLVICLNLLFSVILLCNCVFGVLWLRVLMIVSLNVGYFLYFNFWVNLIILDWLIFIIFVNFCDDRLCIVLGEFSVNVVNFDLFVDSECLMVLILIKVDMIDYFLFIGYIVVVIILILFNEFFI